jgi:ATP-dependent Lhr-like helicase
VYISPLKALGNDIERNLQEPLKGITQELLNTGYPEVKIKIAVRTGDTTASERTSMLKIPPHILVTTPESLYLLLTSINGRKMLSSVKTVIVDEIHAIADDKRGSHLSLSLERLENLVANPLKRIGLSATQKPVERIADYLTGNRKDAFCKIINSLHRREYDLGLVIPSSPLSSVMSNEVWTEVHQTLVSLIREHQTTLIFVNTRRLAERLTFSLSEYLGKDVITAHHGSMSRNHREQAEKRLKQGDLKAMVATASLELGIDIGSVDLVIQISSPRRISTFVQRLGRSRHFVHGIPKGRIVPLTLDDLLECTALLDSLKRGELDELKVPDKPADVLAQQIVAEVSSRDYGYEELFHLVKKAYPYRDLSEKEYEDIVETLAKGYTTRRGRGHAYLYVDKVNMTVKARKAARLTALINGGTIPDNFDYDVILEPENTFIGTVNEDFAVESLPGDIFQLGNSSWKITKIENGKVRVQDARGQPPGMPFWLGEAPGRSDELSFSVSRLIKTLSEDMESSSAAELWLKEYLNLPVAAAEQLVNYLLFTKAALGGLPGIDTLIMERFFDEAGDMHLVIHSVFGLRVNKAWGLALRKRFCRKFNFELQAAATENSIVLSLGSTHSFPIEEVFSYLSASTVRNVLTQALLDSPLFEVRWRWNASIALALIRRRAGKKVPAQIQRMQSEDLIALVFPDQLACFENIQGEREIPDHPLVNQTIYDCLHEAMDIDKLEEILNDIKLNKIKTIAVDLREPSPMAQEVLVAQPYAFLDNAPLEERRVRAVHSRRWSSVEEASSMSQLDADAIGRVTDEVWPLVRNADELYEALMVSGFIRQEEIVQKNELDSWQTYFTELIHDNRATLLFHPDRGYPYWVAVERLPELQKIMPSAIMSPKIPIPENILKLAAKVTDPLVEIIRSRLEISGPVSVTALSNMIPVPVSEIERGLLMLENEGFVFRGHFFSSVEEEWCERRLLARIHRYTIDKLRNAIQPVSPSEFMHFLFQWHQMLPGQEREGPAALEAVLNQLEGYEAPSVAWEGDIFPARVKKYTYTMLDLLLMTGKYIWGRFKINKPEGYQFSNVPIRTTPIAFIKQESLKHYQSNNLGNLFDSLSINAKTVYHILSNYGAQFFMQIEEKSKLLRSQVEDAIVELISVGMVTSDSYTGLRTLLIPDRYYTDKRKSGKITFNLQQAGRWWIIAPLEKQEDINSRDDYLESVASLLLKRYGIVFRKIVEKERLLSIWYDLLKIYRKMEARGTIRGGRFLEGFGGEQYALPEAVASLRELKKQALEAVDAFVSVSGADPLNLTGYITPGKRVPALYGNRILYKNGTPVAIKEGKDIAFIKDEDEETKWKLKKLLIQRNVQPELRPYLVY